MHVSADRARLDEAHRLLSQDIVFKDLGLVIANHALSTVDAFITVRLRRHVEAGAQRFQLTGSFPLGRRQ